MRLAVCSNSLWATGLDAGAANGATLIVGAVDTFVDEEEQDSLSCRW